MVNVMMRDLKDIVVTTYPFNKAGVRVASEPSFAFSTGTKGVQPSKIYIISGGACTELWYFKHIKDICGFGQWLFLLNPKMIFLLGPLRIIQLGPNNIQCSPAAG